MNNIHVLTVVRHMKEHTEFWIEKAHDRFGYNVIQRGPDDPERVFLPRRAATWVGRKFTKRGAIKLLIRSVNLFVKSEYAGQLVHVAAKHRNDTAYPTMWRPFQF